MIQLTRIIPVAPRVPMMGVLAARLAAPACDARTRAARPRRTSGLAPLPARPAMSTRTTLLLSICLVGFAAAPSHAAQQLAQPSTPVPRLGPLQDQAFDPPPAPEVYDEVLASDAPVATDQSFNAGFTRGYSRSGDGYSWQLMPQGLIYRSYLAGAKESRLRTIWNNEQNDGNQWDMTLGGNVGLIRYGTRGDARPQGWQLGMEGAGLVRLDIDENRDVDAVDFRGGFPITWGDDIHQVKLAYYHLSSHLGDEFLLKNPGFNRLNYSRDVLVYGHSLYPQDNWRVYGEIGYAFDCDVAKPWEMQFGVDWSPSGRTGPYGAPFAAVNGHLREEVDYGGNFVVQGGWAWRRSASSGLFRLGVEYFNGKDEQFSFFNQSVQKVGAGLWYDF